MFDDFARQIGKAAQTLAGNANPDLAAGLLDLLKDRGGLDGLVRRFHEAGLDDVLASWVSTGPNRPITPDDLAKILDPEQLSELSRRAGVALSRVPEALATLLPTLVDRLTPDGELPGPYQLLRMATSFLRGDRGTSS